jgi:hypothetical protein
MSATGERTGAGASGCGPGVELHNKGMKLTGPERIAARQLIPCVRRTVPSPMVVN